METEPKRAMLGEFVLLETLGTGATAKVKLAYHPTTLETYAIKILKPTYSIRRVTELEKEIMILSSLKHSNIVNLVQVLESVDHKKKNGTTKTVTALVFEYISGGDLFEYLLTTGRFTENTARTHFRTLIETVQYCHEQGITHRDLKPENLLLDADFNVKIADFGFATLLCGREDDGRLLSYLGTEAYMAPEILSRQPYNGSAVDIFACGVILFIMLSGHPPFEKAVTGDRNYKFIAQNSHDSFWGRQEANKPVIAGQPFYSPDFKNLINGMLSHDPAVRLTISEIKAHPWYTENGTSMEEIKQEFTERKAKVDERLKKEKQKKEELKKLAVQNQNSRVPMGIFKGIKPFRSTEGRPIEEQLGSKIDFDTKRTIEEHQKKVGFKPFSEVYSALNPEELFKIVCYGCELYLNEYTVNEKEYKVKGMARRDEGRCNMKIEITKVDDMISCIEFHRIGNNSWIFYQVVESIKKKISEFLYEYDDNLNSDKGENKKPVE